jgi:hypothetical protein
VDLASDLRARVVEGGQAVHEPHVRIAGQRDRLRVHLIRLQQLDPLRPRLRRLAHRDPHVGEEDVAAAHRFGDVLGDRHLRVRLFQRDRDEVARRPERGRRGDPHVHPELRAADQVRVRHVEARVAEVAERDVVERLRDVLADRQEVREHLRRVPLLSQPVEDRHARPLRERVHVLVDAAVADRVVDAAEHARGVLHRLLAAEVRAARPDVGDVRALVVRGDLEGRTRACGVLLEEERKRLALEPALFPASRLGRLQLGRELEQMQQLVARVVRERKEVPAAQVDHGLIFVAERTTVPEALGAPPPASRPYAA